MESNSKALRKDQGTFQDRPMSPAILNSAKLNFNNRDQGKVSAMPEYVTPTTRLQKGKQQVGP